jgi:hypothetical protein
MAFLPRLDARPYGVLLLLAIALSCITGAARASVLDDDAATFLQRFIGYIEWPAQAFEQPGSAIVVGIAGSENTLTLLTQAVTGKLSQGRPVQVQRLEKPDERLAQVHLAFVGQEAWRYLPQWVKACRQHEVVLATDAPNGVAQGAVLGLVTTGQRTRFEASPPAAAQVGVKLSARLLEVAERVWGGPR